MLKARADLPQWKRKFLDYVTGQKLKRILLGTEERPVEFTHAQLTAIPASSRYLAESDRQKLIRSYDNRCEEAFSAICQAMEEDPLIYGCHELEQLRDADPHDPAAAYTLIMELLQPSHVDAQMTAETLIATFGLKDGESLPSAIQRLAVLVQSLPLENRPDERTKMKHIKRAVKLNEAAKRLYMTKIESMMEREDPPVTYAVFCQGLMRKYDESLAEATQEAALHTELKQSGTHHQNEFEAAHYATYQSNKTRGYSGKGGKGGGRGNGGGRGAYYHGADYSRGGGKKGSNWESSGKKRSFGRGGQHGDGGKGYYGSYNNGGKGHNDDVKFDGNCHNCGKYGHKGADCYSKKKQKK